MLTTHIGTILKTTNKLLLLIFFLLTSSIALADKQFIVAFSQDTLANDWRAAQAKDVEKILSQHKNIKFILKDAEGNAARQVQQIDELAEKGIDLLITSPLNAHTLSLPIRKIYNKGIPVILLDRGINEKTYTSFIRPDNRKIARSAAKYIVKQLNGKGTVLMLEGIPGATPTIHRTEEFKKYVSTYPNIKIISKVANYLRPDAIMAVDSLIIEGMKFDAIYAQSDSMAIGARIALKKHKMNPRDMLIVGIDYIKEAQQAIKDGDQDASFTYPTGGKEGALYAIDIMNGKKIPKDVIIDSIMVTKKNADSVKPIF